MSSDVATDLVAAAVRARRRSLGLTTQDVGERLTPRRSARTVRRLESGTPTVMTWLPRLAAALGTTEAELLRAAQEGVSGERRDV